MPYRFDTLEDVKRHLALHTDFEKMARFAYHERAFNLDRTRRLLAALGNPQERFHAVHIAGTKGKGSVSHMIDAGLKTAGIPCGLFTSPHLISMVERIRVQGRPVGEEAFCRAMARVADAADAVTLPPQESPTFFERMFALSCVLFAEYRVLWAVVEVGLGGRLDATNVLQPAVCAITRLALDHTAVLGDRLEAIAREKAGILKSGVPAVIAENRREALDVVG
ncbi:MAG: bifunctional folylpolyglutamate synthase/dihydrofolate synthase [Planctomycetota bacterium]|jgi:dihydrofolate synthase/folylpolyglutamate synthase